jgi:hypothetical protein
MNIYYTFDGYKMLPIEIQCCIIRFLPKHPIMNVIGKFCIYCKYCNIVNQNPHPTFELGNYYCQHVFCDLCIVKKYVPKNTRQCKLCRGDISHILEEYDENAVCYNEPGYNIKHRERCK